MKNFSHTWLQPNPGIRTSIYERTSSSRDSFVVRWVLCFPIQNPSQTREINFYLPFWSRQTLLTCFPQPHLEPQAANSLSLHRVMYVGAACAVTSLAGFKWAAYESVEKRNPDPIPSDDVDEEKQTTIWEVGRFLDGSVRCVLVQCTVVRGSFKRANHKCCRHQPSRQPNQPLRATDGSPYLNVLRFRVVTKLNLHSEKWSFGNHELYSSQSTRWSLISLG